MGKHLSLLAIYPCGRHKLQTSLLSLPVSGTCRIAESLALGQILHMELLFWVEVCFPKHFDTLVGASGLSFDKKNFGICCCFLGCRQLPWQGAGSPVKRGEGFFFSFKYFLCLDGSGLGVGLSACLEMMFCFSSNNFPLLSVILFLHWRFWFYRWVTGNRNQDSPQGKVVEFCFIGLSAAGSSYFMRTAWAPCATRQDVACRRQLPCCYAAPLGSLFALIIPAPLVWLLPFASLLGSPVQLYKSNAEAFGAQPGILATACFGSCCKTSCGAAGARVVRESVGRCQTLGKDLQVWIEVEAEGA